MLHMAVQVQLESKKGIISWPNTVDHIDGVLGESGISLLDITPGQDPRIVERTVRALSENLSRSNDRAPYYLAYALALVGASRDVSGAAAVFRSLNLRQRSLTDIQIALQGLGIYTANSFGGSRGSFLKIDPETGEPYQGNVSAYWGQNTSGELLYVTGKLPEENSEERHFAIPHNMPRQTNHVSTNLASALAGTQIEFPDFDHSAVQWQTSSHRRRISPEGISYAVLVNFCTYLPDGIMNTEGPSVGNFHTRRKQ